MALALYATTEHGTAAYCRSMGLRALSSSRLPALDHQKGDAVGFASRRLPYGRWVHPSQPHPATSLLSRTPRLRSGKLPGCAAMAAPGYFIRVRADGSSRSHAQSLAHQQIVNVSADVPHLSIVLSKPTSFAGSIIASERGQIIGNSGQVGAA